MKSDPATQNIPVLMLVHEIVPEDWESGADSCLAHLDMTSAQVMERALAHFPDAVVVVSHDRFFIDKIATRLLIFEDVGRVREVAGNWTIWQASIG
jgi:ATPase subunit of ABC transporter with duplicated ATPase domains